MKLYFKRTIVVGALLIAIHSQAQKDKPKEYQFAKIGNMDVAGRIHLLKENLPAELPEKYLPVSNDKNAAFEPLI